MHQDCTSGKKRGICHERKGARDIRDAEDWGGQENSAQGVESLLLGFSPRPRVVFASEEDNGCDDVGVVRNELAVKVCRAKEGAYCYAGCVIKSLAAHTQV